MTPAQLKNLMIFVAVVALNMAAIAVAAALAANTMPGFRDDEFFAPARTEAIGLLALVIPILGGWITQNRPRFGSEKLASEVNSLRDRGYSRHDLQVVPKPGVVPDRPTTPADLGFGGS